jgi:prevent-host-death family protein
VNSEEPGLDNDHVVTRVTDKEARANLFVLLDEVAAGQEIEITRRGRSVARIVSARTPQRMRASLAGVAITAAADEMLFSTSAHE